MTYTSKHGRPVSKTAKIKSSPGIYNEQDVAYLADGIIRHSGLPNLMAKLEIAKADIEAAKAKKSIVDNFFNGSKLDFKTTPTENYFKRRDQNGY